jgi:hypothetical protein
MKYRGHSNILYRNTGDIVQKSYNNKHEPVAALPSEGPHCEGEGEAEAKEGDGELATRSWTARTARDGEDGA